MRPALILSLLAAGPALAQEVSFDPAGTAACVAGVSTLPERRACIGVSAEACMESAPSGFTTVGMSTCTAAELEYWDGRLNAAYQARRAEARDVDAENVAIGASGPSLSEALLAAQRAWIPWRDATCAFERAQWGAGTGAGPAGLSCLLHMTAEQALYLEFTKLGE